MATILVTGATGFIGMSVTEQLLARGDRVIGIDNLNDYYDVTLKHARLERLKKNSAFSFHKANIQDKEVLFSIVQANPEIENIIHLAAQAGVRYSLINPYAYIETNVMGHLVMMEAARLLPKLKHFVYASSSSVYGGNTKIPFSVDDIVEKPISLYAATKKTDELMSWTYAHLYGLPITGLRFFTVYGPWGRPDMAAYIFARKILAGEPIAVFNHGKMRRDFTYIDDIVAGVLGVMEKPPQAEPGKPPVKVYNLGNSRVESLMTYIETIEKALDKKAIYDFQPLQQGDVPETYADIAASTRDFGFNPKISIDIGIPRFIDWYKSYHKC